MNGERVELRVRGCLLGVIDRGAQRLEIKKGHRFFEVDLAAALVGGSALILERVLHPEGAPLIEQSEGVQGARPAE